MGNKYSSVAISGYNTTPPSDDGSIVDANKVKWATHKTKIGDPLYNAITAIDAALVTRFAEEALLKTAGYTTTATDNAKLLEVTGTNTILLLDASTGGAGYQINVINTGVGVVTVGRATAGNTINGVAGNWTLNPGNGASFRVNSTLNGYHVIGTALATGAGLTDVVHLAGAETITGVKTLTGSIPLQLSSGLPVVQGRETGQALPAGLWRMYLPNTDNKVYFIKNTAAAGDFSTQTVAFDFSDALATFNGQIICTDGTAANRVVTKGQLDAKVYAGQIANGGAASVTYGPTGWTVSRSGTGVTVVTHNLNATSYGVTASAAAGNSVADVTANGINSFTVNTYTASTGAALDTGYNFVLARN